MLAHTSQKSVSLPQGIEGGFPGDGGRWIINRGGEDERTLPYAIGDVEPLRTGDTVTHHTPGGGGYGDPRQRPIESIVEDVRAGLVSVTMAEIQYGVVVDPRTYEARRLDI